MLDGAVFLVDPAFIQQIMMSHCNHIALLIPCLIQDFLHPAVGFCTDHTAHFIAVFILAAVQHQQPGTIRCLRHITQRIRITADGILITKLSINLPKIVRCCLNHRDRITTLIGSRLGIVDIVVSRNYQNLDSRFFYPLQFGSQSLMASSLTFQRQIPA